MNHSRSREGVRITKDLTRLHLFCSRLTQLEDQAEEPEIEQMAVLNLNLFANFLNLNIIEFDFKISRLITLLYFAINHFRFVQQKWPIFKCSFLFSGRFRKPLHFYIIMRFSSHICFRFHSISLLFSYSNDKAADLHAVVDVLFTSTVFLFSLWPPLRVRVCLSMGDGDTRHQEVQCNASLRN